MPTSENLRKRLNSSITLRNDTTDNYIIKMKRSFSKRYFTISRKKTILSRIKLEIRFPSGESLIILQILIRLY